MSQKGNKGKDNTPNRSDNTPRKDNTPSQNNNTPRRDNTPNQSNNTPSRASTSNQTNNTPRKDNTPDKGKNAAVASKTYKEKEKTKEKENARVPAVTIGGVRYDAPNQQITPKTFKQIVAANPTTSLLELREDIKDKGRTLTPKAKDYFTKFKDTLNQPTSGNGDGDAASSSGDDDEVTFTGGDTDNDGNIDAPRGAGPFEWQAYGNIALGELQKETATESEAIRGKYLAEVAKIQGQSANYRTDADERTQRYSDDSEERWRMFASTADKEKAIEVQRIVAAGLRDVAEIEGSYGLKGIQAKGEADKAVMGIRAQADKDISRMDNTSRMYSLLGLAFG
jgi:hypothetical protein